MSSNIQPKCFQKEMMPFVETDGTFVPCCWLTTSPYKIDILKKLYGSDYDKLNLEHNTVENIIEMWDRIAETWNTDTPFYSCVEECGEK